MNCVSMCPKRTFCLFHWSDCWAPRSLYAFHPWDKSCFDISRLYCFYRKGGGLLSLSELNRVILPPKYLLKICGSVVLVFVLLVLETIFMGSGKPLVFINLANFIQFEISTGILFDGLNCLH